MKPQPNEATKTEILARIDREIFDLLKNGKLSPLDYELDFPPEAQTDRRENLKALLKARQHFQEKAACNDAG